MNYFSTRDQNKKSVTSAVAIKQGLANDGGLFVPDSIPALSKDEVLSWCEKSYPERAAFVLSWT